MQLCIQMVKIPSSNNDHSGLIHKGITSFYNPIEQVNNPESGAVYIPKRETLL